MTPRLYGSPEWLEAVDSAERDGLWLDTQAALIELGFMTDEIRAYVLALPEVGRPAGNRRAH